MARKQVGITMEKELWQKAKEKYGSRNVSNRIEKLVAEDLDGYEKTKNQELDPLGESALADKQRKLAGELLSRNNFPYKLTQISNIARNQGIYSKSHFVKKAVRAIDKDNNIPARLNGGALKEGEISCSCGAQMTPTVVQNHQCKCPKCERRIKMPIDDE